MTKIKLTDAQRRALGRLEAFGVARINKNTAWALERLGLVEIQYDGMCRATGCAFDVLRERQNWGVA